MMLHINKLAKLTLEFDNELLSFSHFKNYPNYLPYIGKDYSNSKKKILIIAESHFYPDEDFYKNIETWYKWKKDVVLFVEKIADEQEKTPYRIMDFSVYHELTAETVPTNPKEKMKYHWEASHYKKELGDIVLDRLLNISPYKDFGVELNIQNIDNHIQNLREDRVKFIDTEAYRKEVFSSKP